MNMWPLSTLAAVYGGEVRDWATSDPIGGDKAMPDATD
jgi:hypothetical protein